MPRKLYTTAGWRIDQETLDLVDRYAETKHISKNASAMELIRRGFEAAEREDQKMIVSREYAETLLHMAERDEHGNHFTQIYSDDFLAKAEGDGFIRLTRPIHQPTGNPYSPEYWGLDLDTPRMRQLADLTDDYGELPDGDEFEIE